MTSPKHTPYAEGSKALEIGLRPLDPLYWIEVDDRLPEYLNEKRRLMAEVPERVFVQEEGTSNSQKEVLNALVEHLLHRFPDIYSLDGDVMRIGEFEVDLTDGAMPCLLKAAYLVQEDLVLMRKREDGWTLVAGSVCFPSSWRLLEKFGNPMHKIHKPVPGFGKGTRNAVLIERIFDNLAVDLPTERFNWSVYKDDVLHHDDTWRDHFPDSDAVKDNNYFLRVERQTLRKFPVSGDLLFTIRIHIDPVELLQTRPDKEELIAGFIKSIEALPEPVMTYKGFNDGGRLLIKRLEDLLG